MSSLRTTNFLLFIIALCLAALAISNLVPSARAQQTGSENKIAYVACYMPSGGGPCIPELLRVDQYGQLVVKK